MTSRLKKLFEESPDLESFEEAVRNLDGDFSLDKDEMLGLGLAYLAKYPDRKKDRNSDEVRLGYRIARICITENLIRGLSEEEKNCLRRGLGDLGSLVESARFISAIRNPREAEDFLELLDTRLQLIQKTINTLPKGMIRERFTGAVSTSSNFLYLFKFKLDESRDPA